MDGGFYYLPNGDLCFPSTLLVRPGKHKLLIVQTARKSPGHSWLEYDLAFWKNAATTGVSGWSRMNLDLQYSPKIMHAQEVAQEVLAPQEHASGKKKLNCAFSARSSKRKKFTVVEYM